jgi:hypothetical protein
MLRIEQSPFVTISQSYPFYHIWLSVQRSSFSASPIRVHSKTEAKKSEMFIQSFTSEYMRFKYFSEIFFVYLRWGYNRQKDSGTVLHIKNEAEKFFCFFILLNIATSKKCFQ